jgi:muramoyltetrapeptide carboxypeptidase LdcA involved in peptidoglycan recycling
VLLQGVPELAQEAAPEHVGVVSGFVYGHIPRRFTLPMGAMATLDAPNGTLTITR